MNLSLGLQAATLLYIYVYLVRHERGKGSDDGIYICIYIHEEWSDGFIKNKLVWVEKKRDGSYRIKEKKKLNK